MTETRSGSGIIIDQKVYDEAMGTWLFSGRHGNSIRAANLLSAVRECHKKSLLPDNFRAVSGCAIRRWLCAVLKIGTG